MAKRSKNIKHKCIHLNDMRLEIAEAAKAKYLWHEEHKEAAEKAKDAFVKLYGTSKKSILS